MTCIAISRIEITLIVQAGALYKGGETLNTLYYDAHVLIPTCRDSAFVTGSRHRMSMRIKDKRCSC